MSGLSVSGGAGGITASYDDITALARLFGGAAGELAAEAAGLAAVLGHPRLLESSVLDPVGGARAGWELARSGAAVTALAGRCVAVQATLRAAALSYQAADQLQSLARDAIGPVLELPVAAGRAVSAGRGGARAGLQQFLTADAGLTDLVLDAAPGGPGGFTRALTPLYPDGRPIVTDLPRADGAPPRSLTDRCATSPAATRVSPARSTSRS